MTKDCALELISLSTFNPAKENIINNEIKPVIPTITIFFEYKSTPLILAIASKLENLTASLLFILNKKKCKTINKGTKTNRKRNCGCVNVTAITRTSSF